MDTLKRTWTMTYLLEIRFRIVGDEHHRQRRLGHTKHGKDVRMVEAAHQLHFAAKVIDITRCDFVRLVEHLDGCGSVDYGFPSLCSWKSNRRVDEIHSSKLTLPEFAHASSRERIMACLNFRRTISGYREYNVR